MKRLDCLADLSREHHGALSLAVRVSRVAAGADAAAIAAASDLVRERCAAELLPHFAEEERWLLPALAEAGETGRVARTLAEHAELRRLAEQLAAPSAADLAAFADYLVAHIRFEERELFPAAEAHPDILARHAAR
ncbi:MAG: hemerythrin cation binding region [Rhodocyclaceae bacterium]|nr:hemerythrin cation binding region [Rhodocyclaceae bacterium]